MGSGMHCCGSAPSAQHLLVLLDLQASQIATFADDMEALLQSKIDLTQQLRGVKEKHQQLQADHATAVQKLAETHLELEDSKL